MYQSIKKPDQATRINAFRVEIGLAKLAHRQGRLNEAISYWTKTLADAERLDMSNGTAARIVRYSIAHALHLIGDKRPVTKDTRANPLS